MPYFLNLSANLNKHLMLNSARMSYVCFSKIEGEKNKVELRVRVEMTHQTSWVDDLAGCFGATLVVHSPS